MPGTVIGGVKASKTNKRRYGDEFYRMIGTAGGAKSRGGGFASTKIGADGLTGKERAAKVGKLGGEKSKRHAPAQG